MNWKELCTITPRKSCMANAGWAYDAYPGLETLDAHSVMTVASLKGPGVITCIHSTQHFVKDESEMEGVEGNALSARGIILEIYYNDCPTPAVRVPLGDFFGDGCCGKAKHFGTRFVEKAPESYNCFIPMPFEKSCRVVMVNETDHHYMNYSFVEWEQLPSWDDSLGYFHATWERTAFRLGPDSCLPALHIEGAGHVLGRSYSVSTDEAFFDNFHFVMEANNEWRIDGEEEPSLNYLGTEDSFGFSWGFRREFAGPYNGMNYILKDRETRRMQVSMYRFMDQNAIRFTKSVDLRINWREEKQFFLNNERFQQGIKKAHERGGGWVDYAMTSYWYQQTVGYDHKPMLPLAERCRTLLHPNPAP